MVRFIAWLGNYDYVVDWIFTSTGSIKGRIGATGIVQIKAVKTQADENTHKHDLADQDRANLADNMETLTDILKDIRDDQRAERRENNRWRANISGGG